MSENRDPGQPIKVKTKTQTMSNQSDTLQQPCGWVLRNQRPHLGVTELLLLLRQTIEDYVMAQENRHLQQHSQDTREQEAMLVHLMCEVVDLLHSGDTSSLEVQLPRLSLDSRGAVGGRQQAQSFGEPGQLSRQLRNPEAAFVSYDLSHRGNSMSAFYNANTHDFIMYEQNKYHKHKNKELSDVCSMAMCFPGGQERQVPPGTLRNCTSSNNLKGFIDLSLSENRLCFDLLTERLNRSDINYTHEDLLQYSDWKGQAFLRKEVAQFLTYYCKAHHWLDPKNVVILNSCLSVFLALSMVLCDPGDAFLIPAPFSFGYGLTSRLYSKIELIHVNLESEITETNTSSFQLTVEKLEIALVEARLMRKNVKGLVLINPNNPLGDIYSPDSLKEYLEFAKRHSLHVIVDEIYMLSVFNPLVRFRSVLSLESLPDPNRTHVIWGNSKTLGVSDFRFGVLYTLNKEVANAVGAFGYLHGVSGIIQHKLCLLLRDRDWIEKVYLPTNRSRMQAAHRYITSKLFLWPVPFLYRGCCPYIWINLKEYLNPCTFEEEMGLYRRFLAHKLILSPGRVFMCKEPGWFRLTFTDSILNLKVGMLRFFDALSQQRFISYSPVE